MACLAGGDGDGEMGGWVDDSLDGDAAVEVESLDVALDPVLGVAGVGGEVGEHVVGDGGHDLDPRAGERAHGGEVGVEELHLLDAVVLEHLHHRLGRQRVRRLRAPVHPQRLHRTRRRRPPQRRNHHYHHHQRLRRRGERRHKRQLSMRTS